jgi:hypothetical protein
MSRADKRARRLAEHDRWRRQHGRACTTCGADLDGDANGPRICTDCADDDEDDEPAPPTLTTAEARQAIGQLLRAYVELRADDG